MDRVSTALDKEPAFLGQIGSLTTRLAETQTEIEAAQRLRQKVFADDFGQGASPNHSNGLDADDFDAICDHLLVFDESLSGPTESRIIGTYRFLPQTRANQLGGFYTDGEFALSALIAKHPNRHFLELGRSCVLKAYRSKRTVELLWQGIWAYSRAHNIDVMTGCASFAGATPAAHALGLSYLYHNHMADAVWHTKALPEHFTPMDLMPAEAVPLRQALLALPPLIKGYLRLGAMVGDGCVIDHNFGSTDVLIILPVERISKRYIRHYGENAERFAA